MFYQKKDKIPPRIHLRVQARRCAAMNFTFAPPIQGLNPTSIAPYIWNAMTPSTKTFMLARWQASLPKKFPSFEESIRKLQKSASKTLSEFLMGVATRQK